MVSIFKKAIIIVVLLNGMLLFAQNHDKWIVVTTINYPTQALKQLAGLKDWRLVVVGDKKTPVDWHLDNCDFLSVELQEKLPYKIIQFLPWNHYSRKNIGYLYAIEHGARIIYETDDDNILLQDTIIYLPEKTELAHIITDARAVNLFAYFGQPQVWPRGYPLSKVTEPDSYQLMTKETHIPIQQGLANSDPDVDAIFRLTRKEEVFFDSNKPPVSLPAKTMCPFNTQNTIFYASAFWGLLLPITAKFRVCDIWRGYCVQRMVWDMDASLCFLPPTAVQYRNEHNLLHDFAGELDLYLKTENLIAVLNEWKSDKSQFADRLKDLMQRLIDTDFYKSQELLLLDAWLEDLQTLNYTMPLVK